MRRVDIFLRKQTKNDEQNHFFFFTCMSMQQTFLSNIIRSTSFFQNAFPFIQSINNLESGSSLYFTFDLQTNINSTVPYFYFVKAEQDQCKSTINMFHRNRISKPNTGFMQVYTVQNNCIMMETKYTRFQF